MKIVQTFWTAKPDSNGNPLEIKAGWLSSEYQWMSWALSCLQIKKIYTDVELITDKPGREILIDKLQLPYSSVSFWKLLLLSMLPFHFLFPKKGNFRITLFRHFILRIVEFFSEEGKYF